MARSYLCCVLSETELLRKARGRKAMCVQTASRYSKWRGSCVFGMAPALEYLCSVKRFRVVANLFLGKCWVRNSIHNLYMSRKKKKKNFMRGGKKTLIVVAVVCWIVVACYELWSNKSSRGAKNARAVVQCFLTAGAVSGICCITAVPLATSLSYQSWELVRLSWAHLCALPGKAWHFCISAITAG